MASGISAWQICDIDPSAKIAMPACVAMRALARCTRVRGFASAGSAIPTVVDREAVLVASLPVTPFAMNQYLVGCKTSGQAALVDVGDDDVQKELHSGVAAVKDGDVRPRPR